MSFHTLIAHFFFKCRIIFHGLDVPQYFRLPTEEQLDCIVVLAVMSSYAVDICVRGFVWNAIAVSHGKSMFSFVRNHQTISKVAVPFCIPISN